MLNQIQVFRTYILALNAKRRSDEGASAVEYGLLVAAIAAVIVVAVFAIGQLVNTAFETTETGIESGVGGGDGGGDAG